MSNRGGALEWNSEAIANGKQFLVVGLPVKVRDESTLPESALEHIAGSQKMINHWGTSIKKPRSLYWTWAKDVGDPNLLQDQLLMGSAAPDRRSTIAIRVLKLNPSSETGSSQSHPLNLEPFVNGLLDWDAEMNRATAEDGAVIVVPDDEDGGLVIYRYEGLAKRTVGFTTPAPPVNIPAPDVDSLDTMPKHELVKLKPVVTVPSYWWASLPSVKLPNEVPTTVVESSGIHSLSHVQVVPWNVENVPLEPLNVMSASQEHPFLDLQHGLKEALEAAYSFRPIWTMGGLLSQVCELEKSTRKLTAAIGLFAYFWTSGPWKGSWTKFGVDPRTLSASVSAPLQTFSSLVLLNLDGNSDVQLRRQQAEFDITPDANAKLPPPRHAKGVLRYQAVDLKGTLAMASHATDLSDGYLPYCDPITGWHSQNVWSRLCVDLAKHVQSLAMADCGAHVGQNRVFAAIPIPELKSEPVPYGSNRKRDAAKKRARDSVVKNEASAKKARTNQVAARALEHQQQGGTSTDRDSANAAATTATTTTTAAETVVADDGSNAQDGNEAMDDGGGDAGKEDSPEEAPFFAGEDDIFKSLGAFAGAFDNDDDEIEEYDLFG